MTDTDDSEDGYDYDDESHACNDSIPSQAPFGNTDAAEQMLQRQPQQPSPWQRPPMTGNRFGPLADAEPNPTPFVGMVMGKL